MSQCRSRVQGALGCALLFALAGCSADRLVPQAEAREGGEALARAETEGSHRSKAKVEPRAEQVLRRMTAYMAGLRSFTVTANTTTEVILEDGEKIQALARSKVSVQRPNKLRSERKAAVEDLTLIYDGKSLILFGAKQNAFAKKAAPGDLNAALDFARDELEIHAPGADIVYTDAYDGFMRYARSGKYLGTVMIDGKRCDHIAVRGKNADYQLWVQQGKRPLPLRYAITTTDHESRPGFIVEFDDWKPNKRISARTFKFTPPRNSKLKSFEGIFETAAKAATVKPQKRGKR